MTDHHAHAQPSGPIPAVTLSVVTDDETDDETADVPAVALSLVDPPGTPPDAA